MRRLSKLEPRSTLYGAGKASVYTIAAGVVLAVCQGLNQLLLNDANLKTWRDVLAVVIAAAAAYGIQPLFGPALTDLLHIPAQVLFFVAAAVTALNGVVSVAAMSTVAHTIAAGALTLVGAVLFGSPVLRVNVHPVPAAPTP